MTIEIETAPLTGVPRRVAAPEGEVVTLIEMKAHLRVDHADEDALIEQLVAAAVAHLDGWRGVLGRAILDQEWQVDCHGPGTYRLPLPDVTQVEAAAGTAELAQDRRGSLVSVSAATTLTFRAQMPPEALEAVRMAIKLIVAHWYEHREAVVPGAAPYAMPLGVDALLAPLRWTRV